MEKEGVSRIPATFLSCVSSKLSIFLPLTSEGVAQVSLCPHLCKSVRLGTKASFQVAGKT